MRSQPTPESVTLAAVAYDALAAGNAVLTDLPTGTLPPNVVAAFTAGELVARTVLTIAEHKGAVSK